MDDIMNDNCPRSSKGEGHPTTSLQGIYGHILWENLHKITMAFMDNLFRDYISEGWLVIYIDDLLIHSLD